MLTAFPLLRTYDLEECWQNSKREPISRTHDASFGPTFLSIPAVLTKQCFQEGVAAAAQDLIPGNRFRGAAPAADKAGHVRTSINHNSFVQGYLSACPEAVDLDREGNTVAPTTGEIQVFNKGLYKPPVHESLDDSNTSLLAITIELHPPYRHS